MAKSKRRKKWNKASKIKIADEIFLRMEEGESLSEICRDEHTPNRSDFLRWMRDSDLSLLAVKYAQARHSLADAYADQISRVHRKAQRLAKKLGKEAGPYVHACKMEADNLKWIAARMNSKNWGDKQTLDVHADINTFADLAKKAQEDE